MMVRRLRYWVVLGLLLAAMPAMGGEIRLVPMVSVREEYNDNINLDPTSKMKDFLTTLSPGLKLESSTERLKAGVSAGLDQRLYADHTYLNALDQFYAGNIMYAFTPKLNLGATAGFTQTSSPNRDIETTGLVQTGGTRNSQNYGISGDYVLTEKTRAALSGGYSQDRYTGTRNSNLQDLDTGTGNLMINHDIGSLLPSTQARFGMNYARYQYTDSTTENYSGTVGLSRPFNEVWFASVDVGCRYTTSQFDDTGLQSAPAFSSGRAAPSEETSGWGAVGNAMVSYKGEKTSVDISLKHDIAPASGRTGAAELTALGISMNRKFTQELSGIFACGYFLNNAGQGEFSAQQIDSQTLYIRPGIRYDITRDLAVDATYTYTRVDYQRDADSTVDQSLVMVRFYLQYPLFE
jgi:hypothetical protein